MNFELFLARRSAALKGGHDHLAHTAVRIAVGGVAVGVAVMLMAVAVAVGFKQAVREKLIGFGGHIQVAIEKQADDLALPFCPDSLLVRSLLSLPHVAHAQRTAYQPGVLKAGDDFRSVVLKGLGPDADWSFFANCLVSGSLPSVSDDKSSPGLLISQKTADLLQLSPGDKLRSYFLVDGKLRARPNVVSGVYRTGFSDYDDVYVPCDIRLIQKLNGWDSAQCAVLELKVSAWDRLDEASDEVFSLIGNRRDPSSGQIMGLQTIRDVNPQIFSWLDMLDTNVAVVLALMMSVAGFAIVSGQLIIILAQTRKIGILRALGACASSVRRVFVFQSLFMVLRGMAWGNAVGLALCLSQGWLKIVPLDAETYYVDSVPVCINPLYWLALNLLVAIVSALVLLLPSRLASAISPVEAIRCE